MRRVRNGAKCGIDCAEARPTPAALEMAMLPLRLIAIVEHMQQHLVASQERLAESQQTLEEAQHLIAMAHEARTGMSTSHEQPPAPDRGPSPSSLLSQDRT